MSTAMLTSLTVKNNSTERFNVSTGWIQTTSGIDCKTKDNWNYFVIGTQSIVFIVILASVIMCRYFRRQNPQSNSTRTQSSNQKDAENAKFIRRKLLTKRYFKSKRGRKSHTRTVPLKGNHRKPTPNRLSHYDQVNIERTQHLSCQPRCAPQMYSNYDTILKWSGDIPLIDSKMQLTNNSEIIQRNRKNSIENKNDKRLRKFKTLHNFDFSDFDNTISNQGEISKRITHSSENVSESLQRKPKCQTFNETCKLYSRDNDSMEEDVCSVYDTLHNENDAYLLRDFDTSAISLDSLYDRLNEGTKPNTVSENNYDHIILKSEKQPCHLVLGRAKSETIQDEETVRVVNGKTCFLCKSTLSL